MLDITQVVIFTNDTIIINLIVVPELAKPIVINGGHTVKTCTEKSSEHGNLFTLCCLFFTFVLHVQTVNLALIISQTINRCIVIITNHDVGPHTQRYGP